MVEWQDTLVPGSSFTKDLLVETIRALDGKKVGDLVLPAKYADFANVFDKCQANVKYS